MASPFRLLHHRDFVRLWACGAMAGTMRWLEILAVSVYTLEQTGSALLVALMYFVRTVPMLLLGSLMGAWAERVDRRKMLIAGMFAMATTACVLALLSALQMLELWHVGVGVGINGVLWTMEHPVRRALLSDAVGTQATAQAMSLDAASTNGTRMLGPLTGGLLYSAVGLQGAYALGVAVYAGAAMLVCFVLPVAVIERTAVESFWHSLGLGIRYVSSNEVLSAVMLLTAVANVFGFSYVAMVPVLGERVFHLGAPGIGLLMSMEGLGASLGALVIAFVIRPRAYLQVFSVGALVFFLMVLILSVTKSLPVAMLTLFAAGFGLAGFGTMQSTILLAASASELRSRVMGVLAVCIGTGPIGVLVVGWLAERLGAPLALSISSSIGLVCLAILYVLRPCLVQIFAVNFNKNE
jgi:MFS family permease